MRAVQKLLVMCLCLSASLAWGVTNQAGVVVQYDASNLFIIKNQAGTQTNILAFASTGLAYIPSAYAWDDLRFGANVSGRQTAAGDVAINAASNSLTFETGCDTNVTDDHVYGVAQMPHSWKVASSVYPHVHFWQDNADQTNLWYLRYKLATMGGAVGATWALVGPATNVVSYSSGTIHQMAKFPVAINMTGMGVSAIVDWKVYRDGTFGTGDIEYKEFDLHYQIDGWGSDAEGSKSY